MRALAPPLGVRLSPSCGLGAQRRTRVAPRAKQARLQSAPPLVPAARPRLWRCVVASNAPKGAPPDAPQDAPLLPPLATHSSTAEAQSKADLYKASGVTLGLLIAAGAISHEWVGQHEVRARPCCAVQPGCATRALAATWPPRANISLPGARTVWRLRAWLCGHHL